MDINTKYLEEKVIYNFMIVVVPPLKSWQYDMRALKLPWSHMADFLGQFFDMC